MRKKFLQKIIATVMTATMLACMLVGCGDKDNAEDTAGDTEDTSDDKEDTSGDKQDTSGDEQAEVKKIIFTFLTGGVEPTDLGLVEDAINEISIAEIGVEVEFLPISLFDIAATYPREIGAGTQIDIAYIAFQDITPYIAQNMIEPLDELLDLAPSITGLYEAGYPVYDTAVEGHVYGIAPASNAIGRAGGYLISVEDLEAAGLADQYKDGDIVTLDEMDSIFEAIHAALPDKTVCGVLGNVDRGNMTFTYDALGAGMSSGVTIGLDSTKVVNMYTSDEYKDYLEHVREWYQKGYILKDAAVNTDISFADLSVSGALSGYFSEGQANLRTQLELSTGKEYIHLMFNEPYNPAVAGTNGSYATIPVTAEEPEAAMKFLDLMYKDSRITNLLIWGIEGTHYVVVDEETHTIAYPEGMDASTSPYNYGLGLYGNQLEIGVMGESTTVEDAAWAETARENTTAVYGFVYRPSEDMTAKINAIDAVVLQYTPELSTGSADLDTVYPEFISKLEANGINEVIADKQAQLDAWLAEQK